MSWIDRLIGLGFGCFAGLVAAALAYSISTFVSPAYQAVWIGMGQALFLGLVIWGWYGGAYALGRIVAWVRKG
jgi:uncharacterized membrane protein required for colicin V production